MLCKEAQAFLSRQSWEAVACARRGVSPAIRPAVSPTVSLLQGPGERMLPISTNITPLDTAHAAPGALSLARGTDFARICPAMTPRGASGPIGCCGCPSGGQASAAGAAIRECVSLLPHKGLQVHVGRSVCSGLPLRSLGEESTGTRLPTPPLWRRVVLDMRPTAAGSPLLLAHRVLVWHAAALLRCWALPLSTVCRRGPTWTNFALHLHSEHTSHEGTGAGCMHQAVHT